MRKLVGYILSWALYWLGHLTSKVMELLDNGITWNGLYPVYNKLMTYSFIVQMWAGNITPWRDSNG